MWDNPDLMAQSPFNWYADGCSVPGGAYPGALNGPCVLHDFAYTNARLAAFHYGDQYNDVDGSPLAEQWKADADLRLAVDVLGLPPDADHDDFHGWAATLYVGVTTDFWPPLPSGKKTFTSDYVVSPYGPGHDPNVGQNHDFVTQDNADDLISLATTGAPS